MNNKCLSHYIREYFITYLTTRRNCSTNTVESYRDTIKLFLNYNINNNISIENLSFDILNYENVNNFLDYLEFDRNCSINTRNQRLAGIKSFCKYVSTYEPIILEQTQSILNIKSKKYRTPEIEILSQEEMQDLLSKPDLGTNKGIKELTILSILYDAALRINTLINLKTEDIILENPAKIIVRLDKGFKSREVPITNDTVNILKEYISRFNPLKGDYFIKSNQKKKYTSNGIRKIINKYTSNYNIKVTPHTLRHTKACHLLEAGVPLIYIRDFLGHEHIDSTEIYAKINDKLKAQNIIGNSIPLDIQIKYDIDQNPDLINWLNSL